ncbi:T9SS type A sorting domain-containing protein [Flavobacterium sp.]|uniref:T9SS type A sorting domain-containing protein n=1 Tax=Flavobacterium sp. TaxID=239 RepID=UPI002488E0B8|nr:T9SS type A sorting domain-containing protein [Flavobacterium sp.]MDI1318157.1 T9SS type A sorting domain-containing protein [Flavobacterium sp.]
MQKNYLQKNLVLSFLLFVSFNLNVSGQSRGGKDSGKHSDFSKRTSIKNASRTTQPAQPSTQATATITACDTYTWSENGQTYTTSGIYTSGGGITQLFSDQTDWNTSATTNGATISTNNLAGIPATASINLTLGSVNISMNAPSGMYSSGSAVGANNPNEAVTITFSPGVYGVSANYFTADVNDNIISGNITATYSDGQTDSRTVTTDTEDFGYFAVTPITSIVLSSTDITRYISLKNLSIATNPTSTEVLDLTINPIVIPTFAVINPICLGDSLLPLPTTSVNGIPGTWAPALDPTTTTTYTFTPDSGECASTKTVTIIVNPISTYTDPFVACTSYTWPVNGQTYTTSGLYSTSIGLTDTQEIDDLALWLEQGYSFNSTINGDSLENQNSGSQIIVPFGPIAATLTAPGGMYSSGDFVGTLNPNNTLTINFSSPVYGVSGDYFTTDLNDNIISGNITVTYFTNGHVQSRTVTTDSDRFGYFDNNLITKIEISTTTTVPNHYIAIKNLIIASDPHSCSTDTLDLTINNGPAPGDTLATAVDVVGTNYNTIGNNLAVNCYTDTGGELSPDVWYKVTLSPCATALSVDTCTGSNFDTILTVFAADGSTELAYSDDDCPNVNSFQSAINDLDVTSEDVVYVKVEGYFGLNNEQGTFGLNIIQTLSTQEITTFDAVAPICNGDTLSALPTTSTNGYTGTWSPTLDNTQTTTYTFTPDSGQCATDASLTITVNQKITPTFTAVTPICNGDTLSALPTTSTNGYTGTWSPTLDNTQTTTYTFTSDSGQCATDASLTITVNQKVTPTFTAVTPICNGDTLSALPTTSTNGYTGTWSPALDNTQTTTYTFTSDSGQCATDASLTITVNQKVTPTFTAVTPICNGDTLSVLPTTSTNGYTGTWSPALDNTQTTTYTFTSDSGQCATDASLTITVNQKVTPTFTAVTPICNGDTLSVLPTTSINGYTGTWSPTLDNTATTTYTFTPASGQCAGTTTITITVHTTATPTGNASQSFDVTDLNNATIADLVISQPNVNWYASLADVLLLNNPLPLSTVLNNGATYYAVAFSATCPSQPFAVTVTVTLGAGEFDDLHFNYYPNPTSSVLNISYSKVITKVTLISMLGQILMSQDANATEVQLDLSRLADATYFVKVFADDKEKMIKIIKQR